MGRREEGESIEKFAYQARKCVIKCRDSGGGLEEKLEKRRIK